MPEIPACDASFGTGKGKDQPLPAGLGLGAKVYQDLHCAASLTYRNKQVIVEAGGDNVAADSDTRQRL